MVEVVACEACGGDVFVYRGQVFLCKRCFERVLSGDLAMSDVLLIKEGKKEKISYVEG